MPNNISHKITYLFPNFNDCIIKVWELHLTLYNDCNELPMLGLKFNHVDKRDLSDDQICLSTKPLLEPENKREFEKFWFSFSYNIVL